MAATALAVWMMTALSGLLMLGMSLGVTRSAQQPERGATPSFLMFIHPAFALTGAVVWAMFLAFDERPLAWIAFLDLVLVAGLGDVLLVGWLRGRRRDHPERGATSVPVAVADDAAPSQGGGVQVQVRARVAVTEVAEQRIPPALVAAHGGLALVTVVLVLLSALGVG